MSSKFLRCSGSLVTTELSPFGVVMISNSLVIAPPQHITNKIIMSCWSTDEMSNITASGLRDYIGDRQDLSVIAKELADWFNAMMPANDTGEARLGVHLVGLEDLDGTPTPSFYHIHDGRSTTLEERDIEIAPDRFNANHDMPPEIYRENIGQGGRVWTTRNGDYDLCNRVFWAAESALMKYKLSGLDEVIPKSRCLNDRIEYLSFQMRMTAELYRLSDLAIDLSLWGDAHIATLDYND